jgi:small-conductance mechanosensitive channel
MELNSWAVILQESFEDVFRNFVNFVPKFVGAILFLAIGWLISIVLARIARKIIGMIHLDHALRYAGAEEILHKAGYHLDSAKFVATLIKWLIIIVFVMFSLNIIGLEQAAVFIKDSVLIILPQVVLASIILIITAIVAKFVDGIVTGSARAASVDSATFIGNLARWAIWVMGGLTAFAQLSVDQSFVYTLFTGVVIAFSLAFGLAFGLGGQSAAAQYIEKLRKDIRS